MYGFSLLVFPLDVLQFSMQRSVPSLHSLETINEEPFLANESQQHPSSRFPLPTTPAKGPKEESVPDRSRETRLKGDGNLSERLENVPLAQCTAVALNEKAHASQLGLQDVRKSTVEGVGWEREPGRADGPGSQTSKTTLPNGEVQGLTNDKRTEEGSITTAQGQQSHLGKDSLPVSSQGSPQVTQPDAIPTSHVVVRRAKSEGHKLCDCSVSMRYPSGFSPAAEVYFDATVNDRIWSKLDSTSHRDSMSSSSSMSSNDTVIDLSLPNLAQKSLPDLGARHEGFEVATDRRGLRPWSANAASGRDALTVTKSKSNPNLRSNQPPEDELCPRPLARSPEVGLASMPGRPTWSRLYMESLKQSCPKSKDQGKAGTNQAKSKSLGDLTSDDIACAFDSKYRSISRSFVTRSMKEQRRCAATWTSATKPLDELTERLKKLTTFQQENDITSPTSLEPTESEEEEEEGMGLLLRRSSSRSQSRVRYIANRAKQAQERQRLKSLALGNGIPIEERGNPEGACCFARGACMDAASLSLFTSQPENQTDLNHDPEAIFMFKL